VYSGWMVQRLGGVQWVDGIEVGWCTVSGWYRGWVVYSGWMVQRLGGVQEVDGVHCTLYSEWMVGWCTGGGWCTSGWYSSWVVYSGWTVYAVQCTVSGWLGGVHCAVVR
jgi:hypothetical protein